MMNQHTPHKISVAPMMDWTDRHYRYFMRLISKHCLLYTEMVTTGAIIYGDRDRFLQFNDAEHPVALQLGGSDPNALNTCTRIADEYGYDEINLNVGCPSDRVQSGRFGACLMAEPTLVAECIAAMREATGKPVTVKTRIGIDDKDSYEELCAFIDTVAATGCDTFIIHARKAWLQGLSPKENRVIPPLHYDTVQRLKNDFPQLVIIVNGGVTDLTQAKDHLKIFDGVMLGRAAYHEPYCLADVDREIYGAESHSHDRSTIIEHYIPYVVEQLALGVPLNRLVKPVLGLYHSQPKGKLWRRFLSENVPNDRNNTALLQQALDTVFGDSTKMSASE